MPASALMAGDVKRRLPFDALLLISSGNPGKLGPAGQRSVFIGDRIALLYAPSSHESELHRASDREATWSCDPERTCRHLPRASRAATASCFAIGLRPVYVPFACLAYLCNPGCEDAFKLTTSANLRFSDF